ncbi:oligosaccharide flippase family protein [Alphaproteobacteria bacterium]|nr:oligosaccharide flippase family protein [Alphaproteobacteria bacterium]
MSSNLISVFLLKCPLVLLTFVLVYVLEPANFGLVALYFSIVTLSMPILFMGLHTGFGRFIYDDRSLVMGELKLVFLFHFGCLLIALALLSIALFALKLSAVIFLLPIISFSWMVDLLLHQVSIRKKKTSPFNWMIGAKYAAIFLTTISVLNFSQKQVEAVIAIEAIGALFTTAAILFLTRDVEISFDRYDYLRRIASYSFPMIFYGFGLALISQSDRFVIGYFFDMETVGLYSFSYNISSIVLVIIGGLFNASLPRYFEMKRSGDNRYLENSLQFYSFATVSLNCVLMFGAHFIFRNILPFNEEEVAQTLSYLLLSLIPAILFQFSVRELQYMKKSRLIAIIILLVALCNIVLTFVFVQKLYLFGAVLATGVSYLLGAIWINALVLGVRDQSRFLLICALAFMFTLLMYFSFSGWFENRVVNSLIMLIGVGAILLIIRRFWQLRQVVI